MLMVSVSHPGIDLAREKDSFLGLTPESQAFLLALETYTIGPETDTMIGQFCYRANSY